MMISVNLISYFHPTTKLAVGPLFARNMLLHRTISPIETNNEHKLP